MKMYIWIGIALVVIIVIAVLVNNSNKRKAEAAAVIAAAAAAAAASNSNICIPFTKAQQDAEKRVAKSKCVNKLAIPFSGIAQYIACTKNVDSSLTPVTECN